MSEATVPGGPLVAVTERSGFPESSHHGIVVALDADGELALALGDVDTAVYPRSSNKPMQADAMLRAGWSANDEQIALACASHDGTPQHIDVVRSTLADAGVDESALRNTADLPIDRSAAHSIVRSGGKPQPLWMNCSGKHSAMVATAVANGWPVDSYLDVGHPLQRAITARIEELAGPVAHIGVDGCGAPAHAMSVVAIARGYRALAIDRGPIWRSMTNHPFLVGGEQDGTHLMEMVPELMAKGGAEGFMAAALPDGRAVAVKIVDGNGRAAGVVAASALAALGVDIDSVVIAPPIMGHGEPVGRVVSLVGE